MEPWGTAYVSGKSEKFRKTIEPIVAWGESEMSVYMISNTSIVQRQQLVIFKKRRVLDLSLEDKGL